MAFVSRQDVDAKSFGLADTALWNAIWLQIRR